MKEAGLKILGCIAIGIMACTASYFIWIIGKKINYRFSYESMVQETVREMVKGEALK